MKISYALYTDFIQYGVIVLILLSGFAFYPGYIAIEKQSLPWLVHIHTLLMVVWMVMLFGQAYLIKKNQYKLHRTIGKLSYFMVPMLLFFTIMMVGFSYNRYVNSLLEASIPKDQAVKLASTFIAMKS